MKIDLDISAVSRFLRGIVNELRHKRLWPVAVLLVAALVAVPVLLLKSSSPAVVAQAPATPPPSPATSFPAISVQQVPSRSHLKGSSRNPFATSASSSTASTATAVTAASSAVKTAAASVTASGGTNATSSGGASGTTGSSATSTVTPSSPSTSTPPSITPNAKPKPVPSGLTSTQAYDVALAMTTSSGGLNTIDPLERLSVLPSSQQPLLVELGVSHGGNGVLFAVLPGTVVQGPGTCTPGPIDCEILSLGQDQTESLGTRSASVVLFAVTGISVTGYPSASAANKARQTESLAGSALLAQTSLPTLSLFQYEPSLGVVVDQRTLNVGGS